MEEPRLLALVKPDEHVSSNIFEANAVEMSGTFGLTETFTLLVYLR